VIEKAGAPARKQDEGEDEESDGDDGQEVVDAQEIFRRHFEAQFKPLPEMRLKNQKVVVPEAEDDGEDWDGLSGDEDGDGEDESGSDDGEDEDTVPTVDVVEHTATITRPKMSKAELKAFMVPAPFFRLPKPN